MASSKEELGKKLRVAAIGGDVETITEPFNLGADMDEVDLDTLLMWASQNGHADCVALLLDRSAEVNMQDLCRRTPLMMAAHEGHRECVKVLLDRGAQVNVQDEDGWTPLMWASCNGHAECVKLLLDRGAEVNMKDMDKTTLMKASHDTHGDCVEMLLESKAQGRESPLIWASRNGHVECVKLLLDGGSNVNMEGMGRMTPLMVASHKGHGECVKVLLERGAQVNVPDKNGETLLMWASHKGHVECVKLLLDRGVDVNMQDMYKRTPLLMALHEGRRECVKLLLERGAQVNTQDTLSGETLLMWASRNGHVDYVKLLLDRGAEVNMQDMSGDTALHIAARKPDNGMLNPMSCLTALLCHPGIDINLKNCRGRTAMMDAGYESLNVFNQVAKICSSFPADSYGKVVLCGNSGAGKSTLTQAIINISQPTATRLVKRIFGLEEVIEPLTAGIIPHEVNSPYANMVIYDLAGHHQYFSSHSACLEAISLSSPAIFLLLQDVRKNPDVIIKEFYYWSTMIDGVCYKCPQRSSVIVVGTHADLLTSEQLTQKISQLQSIAKTAISHQKLVDVVAINLTNNYSEEMNQFSHLLYDTVKHILSISPPISMMCHMMLAFLKERLPPGMHVISLSDLLVRLEADQEKFINPDNVTVVPLVKTLSEKGLIVFIPFEDPNSSWIVLDKESILKKVNGTLFADPSLKKYTHLASNTGIIPAAVIKKTFPEYNTEMITQFMIHFELCQAVDLSQVRTNMAPEDSSSSDLGPLFFFPVLVNVDRPSSATVPDNSFCWSMIVKRTNLFFTTRFLHVLLRRLPSEFALPPVQAKPLHSHLIRSCDVWSRGIKWLNETGVTTVVEMSESFQSFTLAMSSPDKTDSKYLQLAHSVLEVIKTTQREFCPHLDVSDIISSPPEASSDHSSNTQVELTSLKEALLKGDKNIVDVARQRYVTIVEWIKIEPCLSYLVGVSSSMVPSPSSQLLVKPTMPLPKVPDVLCPLSEMIGQVVEQLERTPTMPELLSEKLNVAALVGVKYIKFGIFLMDDATGVIVEALETEHRGNAERINMAILQRWLQGKGLKPVTWSTLITVLKNIGM